MDTVEPDDNSIHDVSSGYLKFNSTTVSFTDRMFISMVDKFAINRSQWILGWDDSTPGLVKGTLVVQSKETINPEALIYYVHHVEQKTIYRFAGPYHYLKVYIDYVSGPNLFSNNENLVINFIPAGTQGVQGLQGPLSNFQGLQGKTLLEAVELMRGTVGSKIEITVRRKGVKKALVIEIIREIIEVKSVKY